MRKLKYFRGNLDGMNSGLVAAYSKKQAMEIIGTTRTDFENYWGEVQEQEPAKSQPFVLFRKTLRYPECEYDNWTPSPR